MSAMKCLFALFLVAACWAAIAAQAATHEYAELSETSIELDPALDGRDKTLEGTPAVRSLIEEMKTASLVNCTNLPQNRTDAPRWFGNPFSWLEKKLPNKCHCTGRSCGCCFRIPVLNVEGCLGVKQPLFSKSVLLNFGFNQNTIVTVNIKFNSVERQCGYLPTPFGFLNFCVAERLTQAKDGTIRICPSLQVRHDTTVGLSMLFKCVNVKDRVFFTPVPEIDPDAVVSVRVLNPFKALVAKYRQWQRNRK